METLKSVGEDPRAGNPSSLPIAALAPDAAPKRGDEVARVAAHVVVLLLLAALVGYCVIVAPRVPGGGA